MACVEANAFPAPGNARKPAANGFNDAECSATSFQYLCSKRASTSQEKPIILEPIHESLIKQSRPLFCYVTKIKEDV
jgi:hypothetical protein